MCKGKCNLFLQNLLMYGGWLRAVDTEECCEPVFYFFHSKILLVYALNTSVICCIQGLNYKLFSILLMNLKSGKRKDLPLGYGFWLYLSNYTHLVRLHHVFHRRDQSIWLKIYEINMQVQTCNCRVMYCQLGKLGWDFQTNHSRSKTEGKILFFFAFICCMLGIAFYRWLCGQCPALYQHVLIGWSLLESS